MARRRSHTNSDVCATDQHVFAGSQCRTILTIDVSFPEKDREIIPDSEVMDSWATEVTLGEFELKP